MNINIIQVIVILTIGLMVSPAIADTRYSGRDSTWTNKSNHPKTGQQLQHSGRTQHNGRNDYSKHNKTREHHDTENRHDRERHRPIYTEQRFIKQHDKNRSYKNHRYQNRSHNKYGHRYYGTPWYNTHYIAPIHRRYPKIGHRVNHLPRTRTRLVVGGLPYFYFTGMFYRFVDSSYVVVSAPINVVINTLPLGFVTFNIGHSTYYMANDTYYIWDEDRDGYSVVPKPAGASQALEEATQGRLFVYPNKDQNEDQQAKDRYECHRWAVSELGVDPTLEDQDVTISKKADYKRGITACLVARDYTVN